MKETDFIVWGAGGHAKVVTDMIRANYGDSSIFYVDNDPGRVGQRPIPRGGPIEWEQEAFFVACERGEIVRQVVLAVGANAVRLETYRRLRGLVEMPDIIHPTACISPSAVVDYGTHACPQVVVNASANIGAAVILNTGCIVEHDCVVADGCHISPGAVLSGGVKVGEATWVGAGATVINNVSIGSGVIVGAGAVVIHDVPDDVTVVGNPARIIKHR